MTLEEARDLASSYFYLIFLDAYIKDGKKMMCDVLTTTDYDKMQELKSSNPNAKVFNVTKRYDKFAQMIADGTMPNDILSELNKMPKIDLKMSQALKKDPEESKKFLDKWKMLVDFEVEV